MTEKRTDVSLAGLGLVVGTAVGYLIGTVVGNVTLFLPLGAAFGMLFAPTPKRKKTA